MKRFIQTEFFILIKTNKNVPLSYMEQAYDEFTLSVFAGYNVMRRMAYRNALIYTREELIVLSKSIEKKM
jgi:hypothetical protein